MRPAFDALWNQLNVVASPNFRRGRRVGWGTALILTHHTFPSCGRCNRAMPVDVSLRYNRRPRACRRIGGHPRRRVHRAELHQAAAAIARDERAEAVRSVHRDRDLQPDRERMTAKPTAPAPKRARRFASLAQFRARDLLRSPTHLVHPKTGAHMLFDVHGLAACPECGAQWRRVLNMVTLQDF